MIRNCTDVDIAAIEAIINEAAQVYRGVIPTDCWHEPYMPQSDLMAEVAAGVAFWGWEDVGTLVGVMGLQKVRDATLIRHAYVRPAYQGRGIGGALLATLAGQISGPLLVGTWAAAEWAIHFYACGAVLIGRDQYDITAWNLSADGRCAKCGTHCHGALAPLQEFPE